FIRKKGCNFPFEESLRLGHVLIPTGSTLTATVDMQDRYGMEYVMGVQNIRRGTSRDVGPRMGQTLTLFYRHSTGGTNDPGAIGGYIARLYLPGIGRHHSISTSISSHLRTCEQIRDEIADHYCLLYR